MPVPNEVYFGPKDDGSGQFYGEVRAFREEDQFRALHRRFNALFLGQVGELARRAPDGKRVVYSPFPLFLMTCVGIETVGKIFYSRPPGKGESEDDVQRLGFLEVCKGIHPHFSRPLNKNQKNEFDALWGAGEHQKVKSVGHIIYKLGRHTMIHGYRGKGVFFTEHESIPEWTMEIGAIAVNPYWFWGRFEKHCIELWQEFYANKEPTNSMKASARIYMQELLG
jgi:hypothetical protein